MVCVGMVMHKQYQYLSDWQLSQKTHEQENNGKAT